MQKARVVPDGAIKVQVPDTLQCTGYTCGPSCVQAVCAYFGVTGKEEEEFTSGMSVRSNVGAHPHNVIQGLKKYGLTCEEDWPMSIESVQKYLDRGIPVMLMIQAWVPKRKRRAKYFRKQKGYANEWKEGHWVVAIGYDRTAMYFEDPSLASARGYLSYRELKERWHDVGPGWRRKARNEKKKYQRRMERYGIAIWKAGFRRPDYFTRALHVD
jgi:predicted double-glycine peptidase